MRPLLPLAVLVVILEPACASSRDRASKAAPEPVARVQLLAINDFHGQLSRGLHVGGRPVGGIAVLAAHLEAARAGREAETLIVHAGDHVGGSPAASALLQDEPSIAFFNLFANEHCAADPDSPRCNVVATVGNHEFDEGLAELRRLLGGGIHERGPFLAPAWGGARYVTVAANVFDEASGEPVLPPFEVKEVDGVRIGFIGAVLAETPRLVVPGRVAGLRFADEAESINRAAEELTKQGVAAQVVLIHQSGHQLGGRVEGPIAPIVARLAPSIDVVVSGHTHNGIDAELPNREGRPVLLTQAHASGTAYAAIELEIGRRSGEVLRRSAKIERTWEDEVSPHPVAAALAARSEQTVAPQVNRAIAVAAETIAQQRDAAGNSPLGNLIADAQRVRMFADVAFMNPGGVRDELERGEITWGEVLSVHPFGNQVLRIGLTGAELRAVLEQQWTDGQHRVMHVSGIEYEWSASAPDGNRVRILRVGGRPLDPAAKYLVAVNNFLVDGGDGMNAFAAAEERFVGPTDADVLADYLASLPQPFSAPTLERIRRVP